jgi:hypothetical protein
LQQANGDPDFVRELAERVWRRAQHDGSSGIKTFDDAYLFAEFLTVPGDKERPFVPEEDAVLEPYPPSFVFGQDRKVVIRRRSAPAAEAADAKEPDDPVDQLSDQDE